MRPTLRQLEYIVTVHRLGRFGLAADMLNVSQPSLSAQIAAVEEEFGVTLFKRDRGGVQITSQGEEFVSRAETILAQMQELRHAMTRDVPFSGRLRLGVLPSIGPYLLPQVMQRIHQTQPDLRIIVREENTRDLEQGLRLGRLDAILSTPEDHPNTIQARLFSETLWVAHAVDDPIGQGIQTVEAKHLKGRVLLTLDQSHRLSQIVYALAAQTGGVVSNDYEGTTLDSIVLMAATGIGVAVVPELFAKRQAMFRQEIQVKPLRLSQATRDIALMTPKDAPKGIGRQLLLDCLHEAVSELDLNFNAKQAR